MSLTIAPGTTTTTTITATLAGAPGTFEGSPLVTVTPPTAATTITVSADNLSVDIAWAADATGDETITVEVDNVQGTVQGHLQATDTVTVTAPGDVITADAIALATAPKA